MKNIVTLFCKIRNAFASLKKISKAIVVVMGILAVVNGFAIASDSGIVSGAIFVGVVFASLVVELLFPSEKNVSRVFVVANILVSFWGLAVVFHPVVSGMFGTVLVVSMIFWIADQDIKRLARERAGK